MLHRYVQSEPDPKWHVAVADGLDDAIEGTYPKPMKAERRKEDIAPTGREATTDAESAGESAQTLFRRQESLRAGAPKVRKQTLQGDRTRTESTKQHKRRSVPRNTESTTNAGDAEKLNTLRPRRPR